MLSDPEPPSGITILEDLPFYIARAAVAFRRFNERSVRAVGVEPQAPGIASILHALSEQDDCTVSSLVGRTGLPNGTLTGLLDTLEADRCIQRVPNPVDGRSWCIRLSAKGRRLCVKLEERHRVVMTMFRDTLSDRETVQLKRLLARVTDRMRRYVSEEDSIAVRTPQRQSGPAAKPLKLRR